MKKWEKRVKLYENIGKKVGEKKVKNICKIWEKKGENIKTTKDKNDVIFFPTTKTIQID